MSIFDIQNKINKIKEKSFFDGLHYKEVDNMLNFRFNIYLDTYSYFAKKHDVFVDMCIFDKGLYQQESLSTGIPFLNATNYSNDISEFGEPIVSTDVLTFVLEDFTERKLDEMIVLSNNKNPNHYYNSILQNLEQIFDNIELKDNSLIIKEYTIQKEYPLDVMTDEKFKSVLQNAIRHSVYNDLEIKQDNVLRQDRNRKNKLRFF